MNVQVVDGLAAARAIIDYNPETILVEFLLGSNFLCREQQMPYATCTVG